MIDEKELREALKGIDSYSKEYYRIYQKMS
jgi:hypothetical protein